MTKPEAVPNCANCGLRKRAEKNPNTILARIWKWHTTWCPGWHTYQVWLAESQAYQISPEGSD